MSLTSFDVNIEIAHKPIKKSLFFVVLSALTGSSALLDLQDNRCALTGLLFQFIGPDADKNLLPSLDRIDSAGHYETGNLQVVCQFINFWKGDSDNAEFQGLLMLVRGVEQ